MLMYDINALRTALSNSTAFRTWTSEATAAGALSHVFRFGGSLDDPPIAVLSYGSFFREQQDMDPSYYSKADVTIEFAVTCDSDDTDEDVFVELFKDVSDIMEDLEGQTTYHIDGWQIDGEDTPERAKHSGTTDFVSLRVTVFGNAWQDYAT